MNGNGRRNRGRRNGNGEQSSRQAIFDHRQSLPIWAARNQLIEIAAQSSILIVVGEPGSGKTTQIPQFLYSSKIYPIACTQPRRVAAITIAQRVAEEMGSKVGNEVGYSVRFDDKSNSNTKIKYLTDGMLVQEALRDPDLRRYKVVVVDEAHERSLQTDVLLGMVKAIHQRRGGDLKLIIMSATLDAGKFSTFFEGARPVYIPGRQHPVEIFYTPQPEDSYLDAALRSTLQIHVDEGPGDILVFLTGQEEIESLSRLLKDAFSQLKRNHDAMEGSEMENNDDDDNNNNNNDMMELSVHTIYAAMPPEQQMHVFSRARPGTRKAILATNIAETSLTIPGVKFVIDPGLVKSRGFNAKTGVESLQVSPVSQAQAKQRSGRAGREGPGKAFRLYTESTFATLEPETKPEIVRSDVSSIVLKLKAMGVEDPISFEFIDPPPRPALLRSLELLLAIDALDDNRMLTRLGKIMSRLPLDPMFGKVLIAASDLHCAQEVLSILAMVSTDNVYWEVRDKAKEAYRKQVEFMSTYGDHLTLLNIFSKYQQVSKRERNKWCEEHFLNRRSMSKALEIHEQLEEYCENLSLAVESCGSDFTPVRRALLCGLFPHAARRQPDLTYKLVRSAQRVTIHPSSVLASQKPECIIFSSMVQTSKVYAREVTPIDDEWLTELVPRCFTTSAVAGGGV
ncbi:hypothetical protein BSKO_12096 [Bryopsis sp. KO-2023]|nr:hypothetical protein BSKO_12096 [Bryopsis sp. KO-2023]